MAIENDRNVLLTDDGKPYYFHTEDNATIEDEFIIVPSFAMKGGSLNLGDDEQFVYAMIYTDFVKRGCAFSCDYDYIIEQTDFTPDEFNLTLMQLVFKKAVNLVGNHIDDRENKYLSFGIYEPSLDAIQHVIENSNEIPVLCGILAPEELEMGA